MTVGDATNGLRKLGATQSNSHHRMFEVYCDGGHLVGATKISHKPARTQLGHNLISAMATQLQITRRLWTDIAGCTQDRLAYLTACNHDSC